MSLSRQPSEDQTKVAIICKNVPARFNNAILLKKHFGQFGPVARVFPNPKKTEATVHFKNHVCIKIIKLIVFMTHF